DGQKAVKGMTDTGSGCCRRSARGYLHERASVEPLQPAKQRVALLEIARFDALDVGPFDRRGSALIVHSRSSALVEAGRTDHAGLEWQHLSVRQRVIPERTLFCRQCFL